MRAGNPTPFIGGMKASVHVPKLVVETVYSGKPTPLAGGRMSQRVFWAAYLKADIIVVGGV